MRNLDLLNGLLQQKGRTLGLPSWLQHITSYSQYTELQDVIKLDGIADSSIRSLCNLGWKQIHEPVHATYAHIKTNMPHQRYNDEPVQSHQRRRTDRKLHEHSQIVRTVSPQSVDPHAHMRGLQGERSTMHGERSTLSIKPENRRKTKSKKQQKPYAEREYSRLQRDMRARKADQNVQEANAAKRAQMDSILKHSGIHPADRIKPPLDAPEPVPMEHWAKASGLGDKVDLKPLQRRINFLTFASYVQTALLICIAIYLLQRS